MEEKLKPSLIIFLYKKHRIAPFPPSFERNKAEKKWIRLSITIMAKETLALKSTSCFTLNQQPQPAAELDTSPFAPSIEQ